MNYQAVSNFYWHLPTYINVVQCVRSKITIDIIVNPGRIRFYRRIIPVTVDADGT